MIGASRPVHICWTILCPLKRSWISRCSSAFPSSTRQRSAFPKASFLVTRSVGAAVLQMRSAARRLSTSRKEKLHIQQFLGCANWLRGYLPAEYGHAAKVLGQWQKPGAAFPEGGLGSAASEGCKAFRAIKKMMQQHICLAAFDEAAAADGSCPLEQIADASGIAVGGSVVQMSRDLSRLKVLMTHSKSLTPAQQNWPPLIQEAFTQLEVKRATRKTFGSIRTLCWTDHAALKPRISAWTLSSCAGSPRSSWTGVRF